MCSIHDTHQHLILATGGTGKTGRHVVHRLRTAGHPVRVGSSTATVPFDWADRATWPGALTGVRTAYLAFQPERRRSPASGMSRRRETLK
ncbi:SDR family oxidoreductase [Nocardia barduliensis]|uniref:SDR family oxidoreductase n=1 Tax=Nocardia barduliensis TaxID=2736643 RepID=UPI0015728E96|nr:hypothetical protein [Nocardia barduliensis]